MADKYTKAEIRQLLGQFLLRAIGEMYCSMFETRDEMLDDLLNHSPEQLSKGLMWIGYPYVVTEEAGEENG